MMLKTKKIENIERGKKSRKTGATFELRVRADLEKKGWIVDKWSNNVEFKFPKDNYGYESIGKDEIKEGKLIPAKARWAGPGRPMMLGAGFCDFIAFRRFTGKEILESMKDGV